MSGGRIDGGGRELLQWNDPLRVDGTLCHIPQKAQKSKKGSVESSIWLVKKSNISSVESSIWLVKKVLKNLQ